MIQVGSKPQIKKNLPREVFRRCRTSAYKLQNSDSVDSAQIHANFLYFQSCQLFSNNLLGEGRDILRTDLYPFRKIICLSIYLIYLKFNHLKANK